MKQFFDGSTFDKTLDGKRLTSQLERVKKLMSDAQWRTYAEIQAVTGGTEQSISARGRDFRKKRFGEHTWERRRVAGVSGLHEYRLLLNNK